MNDTADLVLPDSKLARNGGLGVKVLLCEQPNFDHLRLAQLSVRGVLPTAIDPSPAPGPVATPFDTIGHVLFLRGAVKMRRSATRPIIAVMANVKALWDWAVFKGVGYSMRSGKLAGKLRLAVSRLQQRQFPSPAIAKFGTDARSIFVHPVPKPFGQGWLVGPSNPCAETTPRLPLLSGFHGFSLSQNTPMRKGHYI